MNSFEVWLQDQSEQRRARGLVRRLVESDTDGPLLDLAGNDYLGLSRHPLVIDGVVRACQQFGAGAGASRLVSGTLSIHTQLEQELATFMGFPTALVTSTGYHANLSVVQALVDRDTLVVCDAHIHASMVDAVRMARANIQVTPHNDVDAVRTALMGRSQSRALVLVETVYSVLGDRAPLLELAALADSHDAVLIADEAHALGVVGTQGAGLLHACGLAGRPNVIATATLSKSLGAQGGVVLATDAVRDQLVNRARAFIYDTGLAPGSAGGALAALRLLADRADLPARVRAHGGALADVFSLPEPAGAVMSVPMPGPEHALAAVSSAAASGVRIGCFRPPSTPDGISRLRLTAHAQHTDDEIALAVKVLREIAP